MNALDSMLFLWMGISAFGAVATALLARVLAR